MTDLSTSAFAFAPAALLSTLHAGGLLIKYRHRGTARAAALDDFLLRSKGWWWVVGFFAGGVLGGALGAAVLMGIVSALALRELFSVTRVHEADRPVEMVLIASAPLMHLAAALTPSTTWQVAPAVVAPIVLVALALRGECTVFLERSARLLWGWLVCVYQLAFASALVAVPADTRDNVHPLALFFFVLFIVQLSDVMQYFAGRLFGKHLIVPRLSPRKTWEGLVGSVAGAAMVGAALEACTPFGALGSAALASACVVAGFLGGTVMSAVKRSVFVKDYGHALTGVGGVMDRVDSVCFAAPVAYLLLRA